MNLATRCPACGTVFRVVPDQLKVSEGWVRCGRCAEVFNGAQRLFELDASAPGATPQPGATANTLAVAAPDNTGRADGAEAGRVAPAVIALKVEPQIGATAEPAPGPATATPPEASVAAATTSAVKAGAGHGEADWAAAQIDAAAMDHTAPVAEPVAQPGTAANPLVLDENAAAQAALQDASPAEPALPALAAGSAGSAASGELPQFLRRAERAERWRQPRRRGLLAGIVVLLATLLAGQLALHYRDELAARWPAAIAPLQAACAALGCRVQAPRHIAALNVDSSALVRLPDSAHYRLTLVLQNKAPTAVLMPAVELALTDTQGHTVVRRVLSAAELGHRADRLAPRSELALQATLDLGDRRVAGYTVELFYP